MEPEVEVRKLARENLVLLLGHVPPSDYYLDKILELAGALEEDFKPLFGDAFLYAVGESLWVSLFVVWRRKKWWEKIFG